jgi:RNA polymerase-binding protein DksA
MPTKKSAAKKSAAKKSAAKKSATKAAVKPAKKTAGKKKGGAGDKFLESQRALLDAERASYTRQAETLKAEAEQLAQDMEPGDAMFDEEGGEGDSINVERERDLALSAQARAAVEEIDAALARLDAGTYGVCEKCGTDIPKERLKALPHAALCVQCKSGGLGRR